MRTAIGSFRHLVGLEAAAVGHDDKRSGCHETVCGNVGTLARTMDSFVALQLRLGSLSAVLLFRQPKSSSGQRRSTILLQQIGRVAKNRERPGIAQLILREPS